MTNTTADDRGTSHTAPVSKLIEHVEIIVDDFFACSIGLAPSSVQRTVSNKTSGSLLLKYSPPEPEIEDTGTALNH